MKNSGFGIIDLKVESSTFVKAMCVNVFWDEEILAIAELAISEQREVLETRTQQS